MCSNKAIQRSLNGFHNETHDGPVLSEYEYEDGVESQAEDDGGLIPHLFEVRGVLPSH